MFVDVYAHVLRNTDIDRCERRMRNEYNVDKPSYDARTMLLSRLKLIDVFPRLMKLLTRTLWSIDNKLLRANWFFCIAATTKGMKWHKRVIITIMRRLH